MHQIISLKYEEAIKQRIDANSFKKKKFMIYITVSKKILYASFMIYTIVGTVESYV